VVFDGLLRRDDPLPALVYYPGSAIDIATKHLRSLFKRSGGKVDNPEWRSRRAKV
jgi:hypothetical protein